MKKNLSDIKIISKDFFSDERGLFYENYNSSKFKKSVAKEITFVQDNISISRKGVLRGMHFQKSPCQQHKLISVIKGQILDVVVDIRKKSLTFGDHMSLIISENSDFSIFIPEGYAHGFLALSDEVILSYKTDKHYNKEKEVTLNWEDPDVSIDWSLNKNPTLSDKDKNGLSLEECAID